MVRDLGKPGAVWEPHSDFSLRVFRANQLTPEANVWVNFVKHSLYPTTHDSTLNVERVVLLYSVMVGNTLNVGEMVHQSLMYCCKRNQGQLYFPGLLHKLCIRAGVPEYEEDVIDNEKGDRWIIDLKSVARLKERGEVRRESELMRMMEDLSAQNSSLMDCLLAQGADFGKKVDEMREDLCLKIKQVDEKAEERLKQMQKDMKAEARKKRLMKVKIRDLKLENRKLVARNKKLKEKLEKKKAAALAAAGTSSP